MDVNQTSKTSALRFDGLRGLVDGLSFARPLLRSFYDTWVQQRGITDTCPGFLYAIASMADRLAQPGASQLETTPDPADDHDALAMALAALGGDERVLGFMASSVAAGLFDAADMSVADRQAARKAVMKRVTKRLSSDALAHILPGADLHAGGDIEAGANQATWVDPGLLLPAILQARRRLCRIVCLNQTNTVQSIGTGFLIGPSAVITNQHVMDKFNTGPFQTGSLQCWFDYSETTGMKQDDAARHQIDETNIIASSPVVQTQPPGKPFKWWTDRAQRNAFLDTVKDELDYAVLRLGTSPGLQRGWYDLDNLDPATTGFAIVLHHPGQMDQTISMGNIPDSMPNDVRFFHEAPTTKGSSGGLLLDQSGLPLGLHHGGDDYTTPGGEERFINFAISLAKIADDLKAKQVFGQIGASQQLAPPSGCIDGVHPLFGRAGLLADLQTMMNEPEKRILLVHYKPKEGEEVAKPGKSFTAQIIKGLFREPEHKHIIFRAGEAEADAFEFVSETMGQFASDLVGSLPQQSQTTTAAYVLELVRILTDKLRERLPNHAVWLMIDDLEHHDISDASGREFLATLYDQIEQISELRVVLIGLDDEDAISGLNEANVVRSSITAQDLINFEELFKDWFNARTANGMAIDQGAVDLLARTMGSYAQQSAPLQAMAEFVVNHMPSDVLDAQEEQ